MHVCLFPLQVGTFWEKFKRGNELAEKLDWVVYLLGGYSILIVTVLAKQFIRSTNVLLYSTIALVSMSTEEKPVV